MVLNNNSNYGKIDIQGDIESSNLDEILKDVNKVKSEPFLSQKRSKARARALEKGFTDEYHMEGFYYFNRLDSEQYSGYDVDILHMTSSGEGFEG